MADLAIHLNVGDVDQLLSHANKQKAKLDLTSQMGKDMEKYVPLRKGDLRANLTITPDRLSYGEVYARAQFYGTNGIVSFHNYTTPGTGPRWDRKASKDYMDSWIDTFKRGLRE
ncbi:Phage minor capsid protein [Weissella jogaejeotgali]|uniref:Phage minor capsid protein n=1 Tax=Weissella jogaejeotgali TaxID=1631871 RepID=A0A1L6R9V6_9LACO|nr:minor capsid protein [Weissella jogaejeotgali]APS41316.1 Phage minor capsid protein [Weissella jogaejeotgali]